MTTAVSVPIGNDLQRGNTGDGNQNSSGRPSDAISSARADNRTG